ncbi:OPA3-like protein [Tasmannia lanceolata]|uniref:OPA3-like protein n=1 Tax=Tasmannia lanceolata TaxID=3420 RepID=UPI004064544B
MILPVVKLGTLALKTLSKPIASRLKKQAGLHSRFRHFIINIAQTNHRLSTTIQRRVYGHATNVEIHPLNEEKAVQAAADLIEELFVFSVLFVPTAVIFEVQRGARSEARKEELRRQELETMKQRDEELKREVEHLRHKLDEIEQVARGRGGLSGILNFRHVATKESKSSATPS